MKITIGIASTTHIDRHNDRMAKSALDGMAIQIKERFIPQLINHDPNQHIGVILYGEVFQLKDGEYALGIVSGIFENNKEKNVFITGENNNTWKEFKKYLDIEELTLLSESNNKKELKKSKSTKSKLSIADLLERHLDSTQVLPDGTVYEIKRFIASTGDLKIELYPKDHRPAHFHIISRQRKINVRFSIDSLDLISTKQGKITGKDIKKIQYFFQKNPAILENLKSEYSRMK